MEEILEKKMWCIKTASELVGKHTLDEDGKKTIVSPADAMNLAIKFYEFLTEEENGDEDAN